MNDALSSKDLVTQLREANLVLAELRVEQHKTGLYGLAADEIERLQAENLTLRNAAVNLQEQMGSRHKNDRWNVETTEDGFRICRGYHERAAGCDWEYFTPRADLPPSDALREVAREVLDLFYRPYVHSKNCLHLDGGDCNCRQGKLHKKLREIRDAVTKHVSRCEMDGCNEVRTIGGHYCAAHEKEAAPLTDAEMDEAANHPALCQCNLCKRYLERLASHSVSTRPAPETTTALGLCPKCGVAPSPDDGGRCLYCNRRPESETTESRS